MTSRDEEERPPDEPDGPDHEPNGPALDEPVAAPPPREPAQGMVPARERRRTGIERVFMRLIATGGIIGIAVALGAILVGQDVAGWIVGLAVGVTSVVLAALLWSSRQL